MVMHIHKLACQIFGRSKNEGILQPHLTEVIHTWTHLGKPERSNKQMCMYNVLL